MQFTSKVNCNPKGSISLEISMRHLEYLDDLRVHMGRPDAFIVVLMDGVQTHVTGPMQTYFASKNLALGLRPPRTSHLVQNEDLVTFLVLRNDADFGYNKTKQAHLAKIQFEREPRTHLDFRDTFAVVNPGWNKAMEHGTQRGRAKSQVGFG